MGLMNSLKKATGLGLTAAEHYDRAYEKGVLLGQSKYPDAADLFQAAARKAGESGDADIAQRATANALLYSYVSRGDSAVLQQLAEALSRLPDVEAIGSRTEKVPADVLRGEIQARVIEQRIQSLPSIDHGALAKAHADASDAFKRIFAAPLVTYRFRSDDGHTETAQSRFFLHQGLMSWNHAQSVKDTDPEVAAEHAGKAQAAFRQCKDAEWARRAEQELAALRMRRTCWMCHREQQGLNVHFNVYPAQVTPYVVALVAKLGQDSSTLDLPGEQIVLCAPCGTAVERQADEYATKRTGELKREVDAKFAGMEQVLAQLINAVQELQRKAHTHL